MGVFETRHTERTILFQLLRAKDENNDIDSVIANLKATMEADDVKLVQQEYDQWKKKRKV